MNMKIKVLPLCLCLLLLQTTCIIEARRIRTRPRPVEPVEIESAEIESESVEDNRAQSAIQYYQAESRENLRNQPLVASDDDYNGYYGQPAPAVPIRASPRADYRPAQQTRQPPPPSPIQSARTKDSSQSSKAAPVQTIRNYSKVNDDGSFTFGYEAADGSFKEETRGTDCVVRGKYGYVDPDGNKREFTYVSGNPCDPNNPDNSQDSDEDRNRSSSEEDSREPENVPQNYPSRRPIPQRPVQQHTTPHAPTTVFQNEYSQHSLNRGGSDEEEPEPIQVLQPQRPNRPAVQSFNNYVPQEITIRQRPKITVSSTPQPNYRLNNPSVSITPRPTYRPVTQPLSPQPPPTTYRPTVLKTNAPQSPASITYSKSTPRPISFSQSTPNAIPSGQRRPVDFNSELRKFQEKHNVPITTSTIRTTTQHHQQQQQQQQQHQYRPESVKPLQGIQSTSTPLYETQLVYNPSSGQYDSSIYQTIPHTDSEYTINQKIQPFVQSPQLVSLNQLQQINPLYRQQPAPLPQFSQQIYEKERENLQVLNSQQLFQQQQELQNQQLQKDRLDAARKIAAQQQQHHRFKSAPTQLPSQPQEIPEQQGFYYLQPSGQLEPYLGEHNINISY